MLALRIKILKKSTDLEMDSSQHISFQHDKDVQVNMRFLFSDTVLQYEIVTHITKSTLAYCMHIQSRSSATLREYYSKYSQYLVH